MRLVASLLLCTTACSSQAPPKLASDTVLGVHVGMTRHELRKGFAPRGEGKWFELESVAGETRLRWAATGPDATPTSLDVAIGEDGKVRELVFAIRTEDARKLLIELGARAPSGVTRYTGPSGDVIVAPGLGTWTLRLITSAATTQNPA